MKIETLVAAVAEVAVVIEVAVEINERDLIVRLSIITIKS